MKLFFVSLFAALVFAQASHATRLRGLQIQGGSLHYNIDNDTAARYFRIINNSQVELEFRTPEDAGAFLGNQEMPAVQLSLIGPNTIMATALSHEGGDTLLDYLERHYYSSDSRPTDNEEGLRRLLESTFTGLNFETALALLQVWPVIDMVRSNTRNTTELRLNEQVLEHMTGTFRRLIEALTPGSDQAAVPSQIAGLLEPMRRIPGVLEQLGRAHALFAQVQPESGSLLQPPSWSRDHDIRISETGIFFRNANRRCYITVMGVWPSNVEPSQWYLHVEFRSPADRERFRAAFFPNHAAGDERPFVIDSREDSIGDAVRIFRRLNDILPLTPEMLQAFGGSLGVPGLSERVMEPRGPVLVQRINRTTGAVVDLEVLRLFELGAAETRAAAVQPGGSQSF